VQRTLCLIACPLAAAAASVPLLPQLSARLVCLAWLLLLLLHPLF
jgi:hypothetical protein